MKPGDAAGTKRACTLRTGEKKREEDDRSLKGYTKLPRVSDQCPPPVMRAGMEACWGGFGSTNRAMRALTMAAMPPITNAGRFPPPNAWSSFPLTTDTIICRTTSENAKTNVSVNHQPRHLAGSNHQLIALHFWRCSERTFMVRRSPFLGIL